MKTMKTNQKRWFMTSALIVCLSATSFEFQSKPVEGSSDLSSLLDAFRDTKTIEVATDDGVLPVRIERIDGDPTKVRAIVPQMTEGKVCDNCDLNSMTLDHNFSSSLAQLSAAILKQRVQEESEGRGDEDDEDVADNKEDDIEENEILAKILDRCDRRDDDARLNCLKEGLLKAMKDNKGSRDRRNRSGREEAEEKLSASEAHEFYKEYIERELLMKIADSRRASSSERRSYMYGEEFEDYVSYDSDPQMVLDEALDFVEDFLGETPSRFTRIRDSLMTAQKKIMQIEVHQVNQLKQMAASNAGTHQGLAYQNQAISRQQEMYGLWNNFQMVNRNGLQEAFSLGNLTDQQYMNYTSHFNTLNSDVVTMMTNPASDYQQDLSYMREMQQRLLGSQRGGNLVAAPGTDAVSSRVQNSLAIPGQQAVPNLIVPQQQVLQNRFAPVRGY